MPEKPSTWSVEIVPYTVTVPHDRLGSVDVEHAFSHVYYSSPAVPTRTGKILIAQLPHGFNCLHKRPQTDDLGPKRVEQIRQRLCEMTGRELTWGEHHNPVRLLTDQEVVDLDAIDEIEDMDAVDAPDE